MKNIDAKYKLKVTKSELETINNVNQICRVTYKTIQINPQYSIIEFDNSYELDELDETIKDQLLYKGFNYDYTPNQFGTICENLIDKIHEILEDETTGENNG